MINWYDGGDKGEIFLKIIFFKLKNCYKVILFKINRFKKKNIFCEI